MKKNKKWLNDNFRFTMISIVIGLIVGAIILLSAGYNPLQAYWIMVKGVFQKPKYVIQTIINATPLILTGASVAFAFKTGLFNIGAEGQFIIGALTASLLGYFLHLPPILHVIVIFIFAAVAAALWGGLAGFLKAKFGVNEVITTIMLNWIAFYFQNYMVTLAAFKAKNSDASQKIQKSASIVILEGWKRSKEGAAWLKAHPFWRDIFKTDLNWGFLIAILLAVLIWYILNKTTLGYELRAVGFNKFAAEYGGIAVKKSMITSMMIAGALAGSAGALHVMGVAKRVSNLAGMEGFGFDGIAIALIGNNSPIGCIFSALLFGGLKYGGTKIQPEMGAPTEIINIMIGTIVFFIAMPKFIQMITAIRGKKRGDKNVG